ncbi:MAG: mono/diheme cytochrome c family protein [Planctomycetota bacterium]|jgi:mono/diheme cytochrome c family protein
MNCRTDICSVSSHWATKISFIILLTISAGQLNAAKPPPTECPQPRFTGKAPEALYTRVNPLAADRTNRRAGKELYEDLSDPSCAICHGKKGDGRGPLGDSFDPRPRNFSCAKTVIDIPDGQLHWIIKNGSPGSSMPSFDYLSAEEIWQLVIYLRSLANAD